MSEMSNVHCWSQTEMAPIKLQAIAATNDLHSQGTDDL